MSKVFEVWLDSGANFQSCRTIKVSLEELGYTDEEWDDLSTVEKEEIMREVAFERADWGWADA